MAPFWNFSTNNKFYVASFTDTSELGIPESLIGNGFQDLSSGSDEFGKYIYCTLIKGVYLDLQ